MATMADKLRKMADLQQAIDYCASQAAQVDEAGIARGIVFYLRQHSKDTTDTAWMMAYRAAANTFERTIELIEARDAGKLHHKG
jgi:hypothetical protein